MIKHRLYLLSVSILAAISLSACSQSDSNIAPATASNAGGLETQVAGEETTAAEVYENATFTLLDSVTVRPEGANPYISFKALLKNDTNFEWVCADMLQVVGNSNSETRYPVQLGEVIYADDTIAFVRGITNAEDLEHVQYASKNGMVVTPTTGTTQDKLLLTEHGIYPMANNYYAHGPAVITPGALDAQAWEAQGTNLSFLVSMTPASAMDMVMFDQNVRLLDSEKNDVTPLFHADRLEYQGGTSFVAVYESEDAKQNLPTLETFPTVLSSVKYVEWHLEDGTAVVAPVTAATATEETVPTESIAEETTTAS